MKSVKTAPLSTVRWCGYALCIAAILWAMWWARYSAGYFQDVPRLTEATRVRARLPRLPILPGVLVLSSVVSFSLLSEKKRSQDWSWVVVGQLIVIGVCSPVIAIPLMRFFQL